MSDVTTCPHCEQPVQPSLHTPVQCLDNMRSQRDEARALALEILHEPYGDTQEEREWYYENQHDWLKQQATVDAGKDNPLD